MSNDTHITYLFGAGASYHAMPVQNELADDMYKVFTVLGRERSGGQCVPGGKGPFGNRERFQLRADYGLAHVVNRIDRYIEIAEKAKDYPSVDTLAKEYALRNRNMLLSRLKEAVEYYFYLRTFQPELFNSASGITRPLRNHDPRYIGFVTSLLSREDLEAKRLVPADVSILSYNYDLELEWAIAQPKEDILEGFIKPKVQNKGIIHLNGRANVYNMDPSPKGLSWWDEISNDISANAPTEISYAWERSFETTEQLQQIIDKTTHLVVIGYSFPVFNREIDRQILANTKLDKIYIQDLPSALPGIENRVKSLLGQRANYAMRDRANEMSRRGVDIGSRARQALLDLVEIETINSTDQFHIPFELI